MPTGKAKMPTTLAEVLAGFMEAKRIKGPETAERLGVTTGALYNWLRGVNLPPRNQAERLAKKLNRDDLVEIVARERERNGKSKKRAGTAS